MKLTIDTDQRMLTVDDGAGARALDLYGPEAFAVLSRQWLRTAWANKYTYTFTWLGRPVVQLPEDLLRVQEAIFQLRPDLIVETGIAHGGSLVFYASLCQLLGVGRVVGVDVEIRPHNRAALDAHPLRPLVTLIEGSSTAPETLAQVHAQVRPGERVLVLLDSNHTYQHVSDELRAYAPLVTPDSYLVVQDGVMRDLADVPGGQPSWTEDNPVRAVDDFLREHPELVLEPPAWAFNESPLREGITHWPSGWLRRRRP
ncbi:MAG: CmcI family methyltransferase [Chloroflexota bacterium]